MKNECPRPPTQTAALRWNMLVLMLIVGAASAIWVPTQPSGGIFTAQPVNASVLTTATLQPPLNVSAVPFDASSIDLTWAPTSSSYATGYNVYRGASGGGPYVLAGAVVGRLTTTFHDGGLATGTPYYYVVQATYQNWLSLYSAEATATTP